MVVETHNHLGGQIRWVLAASPWPDAVLSDALCEGSAGGQGRVERGEEGWGQGGRGAEGSGRVGAGKKVGSGGPPGKKVGEKW